MVTIRTVLKPKIGYFLLDPGGFVWPGRVDAWVEAREKAGPGFRVLSSPRTVRLPARAVVYFAADDNVKPSHLDSLRRNWSDATSSVEVESIAIVPNVASVADDLDAIGGESLQSQIGKAIGTPLSNAAWMFLVAGAVGVAVYAVIKSEKGTLTWG